MKRTEAEGPPDEEMYVVCIKQVEERTSAIRIRANSPEEAGTRAIDVFDNFGRDEFPEVDEAFYDEVDSVMTESEWDAAKAEVRHSPVNDPMNNKTEKGDLI